VGGVGFDFYRGGSRFWGAGDQPAQSGPNDRRNRGPDHCPEGESLVFARLVFCFDGRAGDFWTRDCFDFQALSRIGTQRVDRYAGGGGRRLLGVSIWWQLVGAFAFGSGNLVRRRLPGHAVPASWGNPIVIWTGILFVYCFLASVLPVWVLLQPRDFINSHQLFVAMGLVVTGLVVAGLTGQLDLAASAPAIAQDLPPDAPLLWPFLFITIACGACSGFHCLVASGTTSKQIACETDAQYVGYGSMLLEGALAVVVILACCAGVGMGVPDPTTGEMLSGRAAWESRYQAKISPQLDAQGQPVFRADGSPATTGGWHNHRLPQKVGAFVEGGANFLSALSIPLQLGTAIIAVLVASFAATTLDTATRLQRYVIQELGTTLHIGPLRGKYVATTVAVVTGGAIAMIPGPAGPGSGGLILWPLFGVTNQLLAGLAFMVLVFFLARRKMPIWFAALPMVLMLIMPGWAMIHQIQHDFWPNRNWILLAFGCIILGLQAWMIVEALLVWPKAQGVLEEELPPLAPRGEAQLAGGRSC